MGQKARISTGSSRGIEGVVYRWAGQVGTPEDFALAEARALLAAVQPEGQFPDCWYEVRLEQFGRVTNQWNVGSDTLAEALRSFVGEC